MTPVDTNGKSLAPEWFPMFKQVADAVNSLYQYGTTAQRPTTNTYLGQLYFDTDLGTLVMLTGMNPVTWAPFAIQAGLNADAFVYTNAAAELISSPSATNGQLLIGKTGSPPQVGTLTGGTAISVVNGSGSITLNNTGVTSNVAGLGINLSSATGNVTITNTGVLSAIAGTGIGVSGATGNVTFTNTGVTSNIAGSGISVSGPTGAVTVTNTGVLSITGTANEIIASSSTGNVTLSTPQAIGTTSSPTFASLTLTAPLTVGNGGTGLSTLTAHSVLLGEGTSNVSFASPGTAGQLLLSTGATTDPVFGNNPVITGGSIDSTPIGATTPSTGAFTTLSATSGTTTNTLVVTAAAPTVAVSEVGFGSSTSTTVGAAGGGAALPDTPVGYLIINVAGTNYKMPYYNM